MWHPVTIIGISILLQLANLMVITTVLSIYNEEDNKSSKKSLALTLTQLCVLEEKYQNTSMHLNVKSQGQLQSKKKVFSLT